MPDLLVKGISPQLHRRLKQAALNHHRSMNKETISILEENLNASHPVIPDIKPFRGPFQVTDKWLEKAIKSGRA